MGIVESLCTKNEWWSRAAISKKWRIFFKFSTNSYKAHGTELALRCSETTVQQ